MGDALKTVAIVGVGLIGGSFALALRKAGFDGRILGVSSPRTVEEALRLGVIDESLPIEKAAPISDLVYLSQPISQILQTISELDPHLKPGSLVTDAGSTKAAIVEAAKRHIKRAEFLGAHPMAGKESRGVGSAEADLFVDRPYVLTPADAAGAATSAARAFLGWVQKIGAKPLTMSPGQHDRVVALTSHLPQLASTALAASLHEQPVRTDLPQVSGPGLIDTTRLALSAYDIWADIIATNQAPIEEALAAYIRKLEQIRAELGSAKMEQQFRDAASFAGDLRAGEAE